MLLDWLLFCRQKGCNVNLYLWLCFCCALIGCVINLCQWLNSTVWLAVLLFSFTLSVTLLSDSCYYYTMWLAAFYAVSHGALYFYVVISCFIKLSDSLFYFIITRLFYRDTGCFTALCDWLLALYISLIGLPPASLGLGSSSSSSSSSDSAAYSFRARAESPNSYIKCLSQIFRWIVQRQYF